MPAGDLRFSVGFYKRGDAPPGVPDYGSGGGYPETPTFVTRANIAPRLGGEQIIAQRITGVNFVNITVRQGSDTNAVDTDWICKNENTGEVYNIRSVVDPHQGDVKHGYWWELLCQKGAGAA